MSLLYKKGGPAKEEDKSLLYEGSDTRPESIYNPDGLRTWVDQTEKSFTNPTTGKLYDENSPEGKELVSGLWGNLGMKVQSGKPFLGKENFQDTAWSAATVSNLVFNLTGKDKKSLTSFKPSLRHSDYINEAFKTSSNDKNKYNLYSATPLQSADDGSYTQFNVGDILFKGSKGSDMDTRNWENKQFSDKAARDKRNNSHTDIITEKGVDDESSYYLTTGGNRGNKGGSGVSGGTFKTTKEYYNPETGQLLKDIYKGGMIFNKNYKEAERKDVEKVSKRSIKNIETKPIANSTQLVDTLKYAEDKPAAFMKQLGL